MTERVITILFIGGFAVFFISIFSLVFGLIIFRIHMFLQYTTIAKEPGFEYIGSWIDLKSRDEPFPSFLTSNWLGFSTYFNRIVKGNHGRHLFYFMRYQRYSYWKRSSTTLVLFVFKRPKTSSLSFLIMPSRLFASFKVKVPNLEGIILNQELKEEILPTDLMARFLAKYKIKNIGGHDKESIMKLLTPTLMECLLEKPHWYVYSDANWLLVYFEPDLIPPMGLRNQLDQATKIWDFLGS